ncbi:MAG: cation transporter, partial [Clostridia bacterium]|nr:cation transporter [Clostridia bacterium]
MQRYQFKVTNLDCAMCAKAIEDKLNSLDWIEQASLNFSTEKLVIITDRTDGVFDEVKKVSSAVEPEAVVTPFEQLSKVENAKKKVSWYLPVFIIGFAFGLAGVLLDYLSDMHILAYVFMWIGAGFMLTKTLKNAALKLVRSHSVDENLLVSISVIGALAIGEG